MKSGTNKQGEWTGKCWCQKMNCSKNNSKITKVQAEGCRDWPSFPRCWLQDYRQAEGAHNSPTAGLNYTQQACCHCNRPQQDHTHTHSRTHSQRKSYMHAHVCSKLKAASFTDRLSYLYNLCSPAHVHPAAYCSLQDHFTESSNNSLCLPSWTKERL